MNKKLFSFLSKCGEKLAQNKVGQLAAIALADGMINGAIRPKLQERGADARICARMDQEGKIDALQLDVAQRSVGQVTFLWQAPAKVQVEPQKIVPVEDLWQNICAAANAAQTDESESSNNNNQ